MAIIDAGATSSVLPAIMGLIIVVLFFVVMWQSSKLNRYRGDKFIDTYLDCVKEGAPFGLLCDKSNKVLFSKIDPSDTNDGMVSSSNKFALLAPDTSSAPVRHTIVGSGIDLLIWVMPYSFPVALGSVAALHNLALKIRKHPRLGAFGNERKITSLMCDNTKGFEYNCANFMKIYLDKYRSRVPSAYFNFEETLAQESAAKVESGEEVTQKKSLFRFKRVKKQ